MSLPPSVTIADSAQFDGPATPESDAPRGPRVQPRRITGERVTANVVLILVGLVLSAPLLWLLFASVDAEAAPRFKWPTFTLANYASVTQGDLMTALYNSLLLAGVATVVSTVPAMMAAYAFSRYHFPLKNGALLAILMLAGVPINILIIPVYQAFTTYGMLNLPATAIFLGITSLPFQIWIIKNYIDAIPADMEEAAALERASIFQTLWRVIVPMTAPGIGAAAIYGFINAWGNFLVPLILLPDVTKHPAPVAMFSFFGSARAEWGPMAAYAVIYALPVLILYLIMARFFRGGFAMDGAIRG